ncbi:ABC-type nitrate/sulfonate/bicarbonate transport system, permease component [Rhodovulum sp. ES.010]|uniref:ABC transporter permease n=1 Tax=Rhodovulum sp. ES.010 TaxID=1882821 RepID=UPI0009281593|nr:ABC transporter permease subunit [Rhodovulum sp. ES.010]SIO54509.1 ABC-type nitrate/sulfonate/bicarbonate transport system, permease component [Rhodovulum sp. ES.010]
MTARADAPPGAPRTVLGVLVLVLGWELAARALAGAYLLAGPSDVLAYLAGNAGLMGRALRVTLAEAAAGFVIGNLAAVALAALALILPRAERAISWLALLVFCLPIVATGPILRVVFGPGPGPQITLAALAVYYTTLIPLLVGLRAAPATWFDLVRSYGRGRVSTLVHVRAMAALPYLFAGLQIAAPAAVLGAMVGEFTGAERGLGVLAIRAMRALDVEATWALATVATAASILVYAAVGWIARLVLRDPPPLILAPPPAAAGKGGWRATLATVAAVGGLALLLWWGALELAGLSPFLGKRPGDVLAFLFTDAQAALHRATLGTALAETALYVLPGYLAGLALGAGLAAALALLPGLAGVAMPVAITLRSVPIVTTAPLIVLLLGRGAAGTVTLVAIMVFFPTFVACLHGMRQAPGQVLDVLDSYDAGRLDRLVHVQLPAMLPAFFAAARMAVPAAVLAVTVVEWLATGAGIGALMALSASVSDYGMLWSALVVLALVSCAGYAAVAAVERRVLAVFASEQLA